MDVRLLVIIAMSGCVVGGVSSRAILGRPRARQAFGMAASSMDGMAASNMVGGTFGTGIYAYQRTGSNNNTSVALTCNQCSVGLFGTCLMPDSVECDASEPNCYTGKAEFPSIAGFLGLNTQGCLDSASCNSTTNGTILGATYKVTRTCCATDKCNPVVSGAGSIQLSLTAAASAALVACVWSSWQY